MNEDCKFDEASLKKWILNQVKYLKHLEEQDIQYACKFPDEHWPKYYLVNSLKSVTWSGVPDAP